MKCTVHFPKANKDVTSRYFTVKKDDQPLVYRNIESNAHDDTFECEPGDVLTVIYSEQVGDKESKVENTVTIDDNFSTTEIGPLKLSKEKAPAPAGGHK